MTDITEQEYNDMMQIEGARETVTQRLNYQPIEWQLILMQGGAVALLATKHRTTINHIGNKKEWREAGTRYIRHIDRIG